MTRDESLSTLLERAGFEVTLEAVCADPTPEQRAELCSIIGEALRKPPPVNYTVIDEADFWKGAIPQ